MKTACQFSQESANKKHLYGIEAGPPSDAGILTLPLPEIIVDTKAEIEELAGALGLIVMKACIQDEVRRLVGERYEHVEGHRCARWGSQHGAVIFAGREEDVGREGHDPEVSGAQAQEHKGASARATSGRDPCPHPRCLCDGRIQ